MVFSDEDKILIKNLYQLKGYNVRQLRTEFLDKGWTKSSINRLLKKFRDTDKVDRRQDSGRPWTAHTDENTDQVNNTVLSQEDQPRTHSTVYEISRRTGIPKSSDVHIIKRICSWNASRGDVRMSWLTRTAPLTRSTLSYFWKSFPSLPWTSFSSQMKRCSHGFADQQREWPHGLYAPSNTKKRSITSERLFRCQQTFSRSLMVSVSVSKLGCTELFFVEPGIKVDSRY